MKKTFRGNTPSRSKTNPSLIVNDTEILLPDIVEAERLADAGQPSDEEMAHQYAEMMEQIYLDASQMDLSACAPDRRFFKGDKEAWVYEHGNIAELVFVR